MSSVTVRNVEDDVKARLRLKAARRGISMEEHMRILMRKDAYEHDPLGNTALDKKPTQNLYDAIRQLVEPYGGFDLEIPERKIESRKIPFQD